MTPFEAITQLKTQMSQAIIGQETLIDRIVLTLLADGNMLLGLLTGEIGSGKTFLCEILRKICNERNDVVTYLENTDFPFEDLLREIILKHLKFL